MILRKSSISSILPVLLCLKTVFISGCGGGSGPGSGTSTPPPPPATITSVSVSPASTNVQPGASQTFTANVSGTGSFSTAVNWSVNGTAGGSSTAGSISSAGVYTAPATPPNPNTVTVTATSGADSTKSGTSSVIVGSSAHDVTSIQLSPLNSTLKAGWSEQFSAAVNGTGSISQAVTWFVNGVQGGGSTVGTIDINGFYTAPASMPQGAPISVTAKSVEAPEVSSTTQVTIVADTNVSPVITQISPSTANAGELIEIIGSGFFGGGVVAQNVWVNFTGVNGIKIPVLLPYTTSDTEISAVVPFGAADGPLTVTAQAQFGPPYTSNATQFTRASRIRIRAPQRDLSSGESETFTWKQIAGASPATLTWSASAGSVTSEGVFTAASGVTSETYVKVTACVQGTIYCDAEMIGVHPFRIVPEAPMTEAGQSVQMQAVQGGSFLNPTWTLEGPGVLSGSGNFTASSQFADGGGIPFVATSNGTNVDGMVEVTGQIPGLVNRIADYFDAKKVDAPFANTSASSVGVVNNRLYVESTYYSYAFPATSFNSSQVTSALVVDVYDISDQRHPVWIDAFEPLVGGPFAVCGGTLYQATYEDISGVGFYRGGSIASYNLSGASPMPMQKVLIPPTVFSAYGQSGCTIAALTGPNGSSGTLVNRVAGQVSIYQLQNSNITKSDVNLIVPDSPDGQGTWYLTGVGSDGKRLFLDMQDSTAANHLTTYDLTTNPATLSGMLPADLSITFFQLVPVGDLLFGTNGTYSRIYDVSGSTPVQVAQLLGGYVRTWDNTTVVTNSLDEAVNTIDITNPHAPVLKAALFDFGIGHASSEAISGNYAYRAEGEAGLGVWDISEAGGLASNSIFDINDSALPVSFVGDDSNGFLLSVNGNQGLLDRFDLSQNPPVMTGGWRQDNSSPQALALNGKTLYEGTATSLEVLDASMSGEPTIESSIPLAVSSLSVSGTTLVVGTGDNRLVVFDVGQPQNPVQVASVALPALPFQIATSGKLALIADTSGGLLIYSVATPSAPVLLGTVSLPEVYGVAVDGSLALLAAREYGLVVVDLSNPANPKIISHADVGEDLYRTSIFNKAVSVAVRNKIAYVGVFNDDYAAVVPNNGSSEIFGFDYSNATEPRMVALIGKDQITEFSPVLWTSSNTLICGCTKSIYSFDLTQPRNAIGLFPLPVALQPAQNPGSIQPAFREEDKSGVTIGITSNRSSGPHRPAWPKGTIVRPDAGLIN